MDKNPTILVVDDDEDNLLLLKIKIKSLGYSVITATSGFDAIEMAAREEPDVLLLDVRMPDMDGFEVCATFKNNEKLKNIPIIFLTALTNEKDLVKGLELGAQDYIVKTFDIAELAARIKVALRIKSLQSQLMTENRKLEAILENIPEGIFTVSAGGTILQWNRGAETITGYLWEEVNARDYRETIRLFKDRKVPVEEGIDIETIARKGQTVRMDKDDIYLLSKEKQYIPVAISFSPVTSEGRTTSVVVTLYDLTRQKAIEKMKEEVFVALSHDLKTPLSAIRGFIDMIFHPAYSSNEEKKDEILKKIRTASISLIRLINNLLFIQKGKSDFSRLDMSEFSLGQFSDEIIETFTPFAEEKHLTFVRDIDDSIIVYGDRARLEEVFFNLISNAIKYTPQHGTIAISAVQSPEGVEIFINDTGRGISPKETDKIFKKFYQAKDSMNGHGLGLYICDRIIKAHKSTLYVTSSEGKGSTFHFLLKHRKRRR